MAKLVWVGRFRILALVTLALAATACSSDSSAIVQSFTGRVVRPAAASGQQLLAVLRGARRTTFGLSVAISGATIVVGAPQLDKYRGAVHVFTLSEGRWTETCELKASDSSPGGNFGSSVAISGSTIAVGAPSVLGIGRMYVFSKTAHGCVQRAEFRATQDHDAFASVLAVSGSTVVVGAYGHDSFSGRAYVFEQDGDWVASRSRARGFRYRNERHLRHIGHHRGEHHRGGRAQRCWRCRHCLCLHQERLSLEPVSRARGPRPVQPRLRKRGRSFGWHPRGGGRQIGTEASAGSTCSAGRRRAGSLSPPLGTGTSRPTSAMPSAPRLPSPERTLSSALPATLGMAAPSSSRALRAVGRQSPNSAVPARRTTSASTLL